MIRFPLMRNNLLRKDLDKVIAYLQTDDPILTQSSQVAAFEREWSEWLGVRHSVFVNSGSSANLLSIATLKLKYPESGEIIVPSLTWASDISAVLHNGFVPVFVDIEPQTLGMNSKQVIAKLNEKTRAVFLTHTQGFDSLTDELLDELDKRGICLIEDVCEAHGATHNGKNLGSFGWMSNFSFYYAHHMSTIEGGMICTNDEELYQQLRMLRSHGMVREANNKRVQSRFSLENNDLDPKFIFAYPAYNLRNTEIGGILGRSQLENIDENIRLRNQNLSYFLNRIDSGKYRTDFKLEGCSNYAFNLIVREKNQHFSRRLMRTMDKEGIEYRRGSAGGGNQLRQPYLKQIFPDKYYTRFPETEHIHFYGFYIGNFPDLGKQEIEELIHILNSVS